jgi:DNA-binding winged helix-turn-helix (wHTH) protein
MRICFGHFIVDSGTRRLTAEDREIPLSPKAFDLLRALLERRPNVVDRATLLSRIWPDTHVVDANLNVLIGEIRRALSDTAQRSLFIRTAHRIGFAFCGEAVDLDRPRDAADPRETARFWLVWNDRTFVLSEGSNVIGRDPKCEVWLDASGVSRQHARIRVTGSTRGVVLEDMKSTNGTFLQRARVEDRASVSDGDVITVGEVELTFRAWFADTPRPTERIRRRPRSSS